MRFTILTQYYPPEIGAPQVRLSAFARELKRNGHDVQVVTALPNYPKGIIEPGYQGKFQVRERLDDIPVTRMWIYPATGRNIVKRLLNYFSFTLSSLLALVTLPRADIIFVESPPLFLCLSAWVVSKLRRQKLCINISDLWPDSVVALGIMDEGLFVRSAYRLEQWLYQQAWKICGVTEGIVETLIQKKRIAPAKVTFLPNGVDLALFQPTTASESQLRQLGLEGKKVFGYTGLHGYAQGLDVIIGAAEQLRNRIDIAFLFVGDGPEKTRLQARVKELRLDNVLFLETQPVSAMPQIFALTTACIVPLRKLDLFLGARPSKMFPPLGCGKPIIYSGAGEAAALVQNHGCGMVTEPENSEALSAAVLHLADQPEEAALMGRRGRQFVEQNYSWHAIVQKWLLDLKV